MLKVSFTFPPLLMYHETDDKLRAAELVSPSLSMTCIGVPVLRTFFVGLKRQLKLRQKNVWTFFNPKFVEEICFSGSKE